MMNYYEFDFDGVDQELNDQLIALLSNQGFEGFEEEEGTLLAFIAIDKFDENLFHETIAHFPQLSYTQTEIEQVNWNQQWEQGFQPVQVGSFAAVRAHFHAAIPEVKYDIVITPKMSFGTGHHPTTYLMMQQMESIDFKNKSVFDFGTGTGVLAILAEKLGAASVLAIDNDEWSINNSKENVAMNHCSAITLALGDCPPEKG
ncbi:MAG: 50S ribosomal protein L11 methyltransferase, partial [Ferruginibacter sp.]